MLILQFVLFAVGAYLLGSIPSGYLMAKWSRGIDLRRFGSGNVGASNVIATGSRWAPIVVIVFDFLKGAGPVFLAMRIGMPTYQQVTIGIAAICGHNWTVFLRFSGGRGILTTLGVLFPLTPWLALTLLLVNLVWFPLKEFALGTLVALVMLPVFSWFLNGFFQIERSLALTLGFVGILLLLILRRLTAPRTELSDTVSRSSLIINRLLFDRDIRNRSVWLSRRGADPASSRRSVSG